MNRPHFRRRRRPIDPNPEYSRLDRMDGLPRRTRECPECVENRKSPGRTRYDSQWPDVIAAEAPAPLADLPADQSGFTGIADWPVWDYGEGYEIEPEETATVTVHLSADVSRFTEEMARAQALCAPHPVKPRGRHRQTNPLDLILADLRDLGGLR